VWDRCRSYGAPDLRAIHTHRLRGGLQEGVPTALARRPRYYNLVCLRHWRADRRYEASHLKQILDLREDLALGFGLIEQALLAVALVGV
jgi:hypothetical protein